MAVRAPRAEQACRAALERATTSDANPWHDLLYNRLRDCAVPAVIDNDAITPAASIWTGSRLWLQAFRAAELQAGDRIVIAMPPSAAFLQVLVAAIWQRLTVALAPPEGAEALVDTLDARALIHPSSDSPHNWMPDGCAGPLRPPHALRTARHDRTPDARFLLRTSGTTTEGTWYALSDANVLSVLATHLPYFCLKHARVVSVLPWHHAFGLVLDLMPALLSGAEVIRDPEGGRDAESILALRDAWGATHLSAVPLTMQRLLAHDEGPGFVSQLQGGIVGGAPISAPLADTLDGSSLRVGYGQTEASPGIALGDAGVWAANYLGQPLGCSVRIADDGELLFQGQNACFGTWTTEGLVRLDPDRWVATGDRAKRKRDGLYFRGRKDDSFKLANGRMVPASRFEATLKEAFDAAHDAFLFSPDGTSIAVALCWDEATSPPSTSKIGAHLGPLHARLAHTLVLSPNDWPTTPKGASNRDLLREKLHKRLTSHAASFSQ